MKILRIDSTADTVSLVNIIIIEALRVYLSNYVNSSQAKTVNMRCYEDLVLKYIAFGSGNSIH